MAFTLSRCSRNIVVYSKSLRSLSSSLRHFSSRDNNKPTKVDIFFDDDTEVSSATVWPDRRLGIFGPKDERLPLPGNIGVASNLNQKDKYPNPLKTKSIRGKNDLLTHVLPSDRHESVLSQVLRTEEEQLTLELEEELMSNINKFPECGEILECVAQQCPKLVTKEFRDLFPDRDLASGNLTVITLSQKTTNDMTAWSEAVDEEREQLTEFFIAAAENICQILKDAGYWADFIDPTSGKPFLGEHTNAVMSETDERYRHFGFSIEDLGCCKVISHHIWGTCTFVGSLFTDVPVNSKVLKEILLKYTTYKDENV